MDHPKQPNDYSCGPTALSYFLKQQGYHYNLDFLISELNPTPELGTQPSAVELFLMTHCIGYEIREVPYARLIPQQVPILVNYNWDTEGDHYSVITAIDEEENITLWNPYTAEPNYYSRKAFKQIWYSPLKKLKNWMLVLA